jgi:hypothetical protein
MGTTSWRDTANPKDQSLGGIGSMALIAMRDVQSVDIGEVTSSQALRQVPTLDPRHVILNQRDVN